MMELMDNISYHEKLCRELNDLYAKKNRDYGNSFHDTYLEEGLAMSRIRLSDKLARFKKLSYKREYEGVVKDESIRDTLIDLANYALMTVMELDFEEEGKKLTERVEIDIGDADLDKANGGNYGASEKTDDNNK